MKNLQFGYLLVCLVTFLCVEYSSAQNLVYKNYSIKDGLASTVVYYVAQDNKGFVWFGTDQGLCRFDGTNFKTFTTQDGLPDNEVLFIRVDSQDRVWMICYNSRPCFIYNGVIHTTHNDSMLSRIGGADNLFRDIGIDKEGKVWILGSKITVIDGKRLYNFLSPDTTEISQIGYFRNRLTLASTKSIYHVELKDSLPQFKKLFTFDTIGHFFPAFTNDYCYVFQGYFSASINFTAFSADENLKPVSLRGPFLRDIVLAHSVAKRADSVILISVGTRGIKALTTYLTPLPDPYPFLPPDVTYSFTNFDGDGNTWITSLGRGVFFIPAGKTVMYKPDGAQRNTNVTSVYKTSEGFISVGLDNWNYAILKDNTLQLNRLYKNVFGGSRVIKQCNFNNGGVYMLGTDYGLFAVNRGQPSKVEMVLPVCVKNMNMEAPDSLLVGASSRAYRITKTDNGFKSDILMEGRCTAIVRDKRNRIWLGTLSGVKILAGDVIKPFDRNKSISQSRITDLLCDEYDNMWVATHQRGFFVITADSIIAINTRNGLPGDACVRFFKETDGIIWVCTNRHLSKITYWQSPRFGFDIASLGELAGDEEISVNDIFVDSLNIWVATSSGLLRIDKTDGKESESPPVYVTSFQTTDSVYSNLQHLVLTHTQSNIQIDFIGISYNSGGNMLYKYILEGDTVFTRNSSLNFNSLAPGKYHFRVWARNVKGIWSEVPAELTFTIAPPFWSTWWFRVLMLSAAGLMIWAAMRWRIYQIRAREKEKTGMNKKINETELQALRAQMNEHFIFNSLNSIQNFINQNNTEAANFYLASFGRLIRRTLDISSMPVISLKEEMDYLDNYLSLEKMRFTPRVDYSITNNILNFSPDMLNFPSMILQPYVENAISHGLMYKTSGKGILNISFSAENDFVVCRIDDNGIGRKKAEELKSKRPTDHESKGVKLSENRVALFNSVNDDKIKVEVIDKQNASGEATGTMVIVYVPLIENVWRMAR